MKQKETITNLKKVSNMKATKFISACAVLVALASCSNDLSQPTAEDQLAHMSVVSSVGSPKTKAANTAADVQDTQFAVNEIINVYLFENRDSYSGTVAEKNYGQNSDGLVPMKADGAGNTSVVNTSDALYYPSNGNEVYAYAYYPAISSDDGYNIINSSSPTSFSVKTDQSDIADYRKSDLMCAAKSSNAKADDPIGLSFTHKLSKIEVILRADATSGVTVAQLANATVKIKNVLPTIALTSVSDGNIVLGSASGTAGDITIGKNGTTPDGTGGYAGIIVPQSIDASTSTKDFINVTLAGGGSYTYKITNTTLRFEPEKKYKYTLTLTSGSLTVTSEINQWDNGVDEDGNAYLD